MDMSWDNELREWYPTAIKSLDFASPLTTGVPQKDFIKLFDTTVHGVNMNVVMVLCNNIEARTAAEMNLGGSGWAMFLQLNAAVAHRWKILSQPIQKKVMRELEIMDTRSKIHIAQA